MNRASREGRCLGGAIFDVEGVIAHPDLAVLSAGLSALDPQLDPERLRSIRHGPELYPLWEAFSLGRVAADDYWSAVLRAAGLEGSSAEVAAMRGLQSRATWACLDEEVIAIADALRQSGLGVAILSNSAVDYDTQIDRFVGHFDQAHFSHRTGRRKPDARAYLDLAAAMRLDPTAIVFIDDKPRNIEAAQALGMQTCLFASADQLRHVLADLGAPPR